MKPKILLHVCCAPCSPYILDRLSKDYTVIIYFYNPNIHPHEEYRLRVDETKKLAEDTKTQLVIGKEDTQQWFDLTKGLENEPERGKRCSVCFEMRLNRSFQKAKDLSIENLTTTLTVSPHKNAETINKIGNTLSKKYGIKFLAENFKKQNGFQETIKAGKKYNFYRQNYCGCVYSRN